MWKSIGIGKHHRDTVFRVAPHVGTFLFRVAVITSLVMTYLAIDDLRDDIGRRMPSVSMGWDRSAESALPVRVVNSPNVRVNNPDEIGR